MEKSILKKLFLIKKIYLLYYDKWMFSENLNKYKLIQTIHKINLIYKYLNQWKNINTRNLNLIKIKIKKWIFQEKPWKYIRSTESNVYYEDMTKKMKAFVKYELFVIYQSLKNFIILVNKIDFYVVNILSEPKLNYLLKIAKNK